MYKACSSKFLQHDHKQISYIIALLNAQYMHCTAADMLGTKHFSPVKVSLFLFYSKISQLVQIDKSSNTTVFVIVPGVSLSVLLFDFIKSISIFML